MAFSGGRAWVEASAPKRAGGENVVGLLVPDALEVMREAVEEASLYVTRTQPFEDAKIVRLDPVRDFDGVTHVPELLDGLAGVPREARHKAKRFADGQKNRAESLRVGPNSFGMQLYDKHVESGGLAPDGRLRFESRLHNEQLTGQWAKGKGFLMREVRHVTEERVQIVTAATFERAAFDREVVGKATVAERVRGSGLTLAAQARLWAFLTMPGEAEAMHRNVRARYRRLAAELGVTVAAAEDEAADVFVRLDFESGTEVCRVA